MNISRQTIGKRSGCCSVEYAPGPARLGASAAGLVLAAYTRSTSGGELGAILDRYATDMLQESPELASGLGVSDAQAGGRYIDRLSDVSRDGLRHQRGIAEAALAALGHLDRASLCDQDRVTYDVVTTALRDTVDAANFETGTGAQAPYTVTQLTGNYAFIPDFLASQHPITNREEAEAYLTRLSAYARVLDQKPRASARTPPRASSRPISPWPAPCANCAASLGPAGPDRAGGIAASALGGRGEDEDPGRGQDGAHPASGSYGAR